MDGQNRNYISHIPKNIADSSSLPLVFVLHGARSSPKKIEEITEFHAQQSEEKFITVYPAAAGKYWNDGRGIADHNVNDIKFIGEIIDTLSTEYEINENGIFAAGMSNGGTMSVRLACENSRINAIATVASTAVKNVIDQCQMKEPTSALFIKGTDDPISSFEGVQKPKRTIVGFEDIVQKFISLNGCSSQFVPNAIPDTSDDGTTPIRKQYRDCKSESEVVSITIQNGGHTWPRETNYRSKLIFGKTSHDFNASKLIWAFFNRHIP